MSNIEKVLRNCEMDSENKFQIHVRRGFCFADFFKSFQKALQRKEKE